MLSKLRSDVGRILGQVPGWHTKRKIVVIESDDWGAWRTRSTQTLAHLVRTLPHLLNDPYNRFDTLETTEDIESLSEVLMGVKDKNGNPAIITANTIMANPDFELIRRSNFQQYAYKPFTQDLAGDPIRANLVAAIIEARQANVFQPQLHGREHLNVSQWMSALRSGHEELTAAFEVETYGIPLKQRINKRNNVMAALDFDSPSELAGQAEVLRDAQTLFVETFGFQSKTFIAPSYIWHPDIEQSMVNIGLTALQGLSYQFIPDPGKSWYKTAFRYTGKRASSGLMGLTRNAFFEPSLQPGKDVVGECLDRIATAFLLHKPAIIGSHRVNFMGVLDERNRKQNLALLKQLLNTITKKWPDVEFFDSGTLAKTII